MSAGRSAPAALAGAATEIGSAAELGAVVSRWVGRAVPHEGYMLAAVDPVTGAGCFLAREHGYSPAAARRLTLGDRRERDHPFPFERLVEGPCHVGVLNTDAPGRRRNAAMRAVMTDLGVGSELRLALVDGGTTWGGLVLLRPRGARPFSPDEASRAQRLARDIVAALRRYATGAPPEPNRLDAPPGVLVIDPDETVTAATPSARAWIRELETLPPAALAAPDLPLESTIWHLTQAARSDGSGRATLTRVPTRRGWVAIQAQPMPTGAVAVTIQAAAGKELLPAVAFWRGLTPREHMVVDHMLKGLSSKQIARHLRLSPHTVNDHLKSIYRKTGVSTREELLARFLD
ncbi:MULTISPECIES: helix-turn-helix transcriptional regulator [Actinomadura]|uniref:Helix-turn-helix transcriptional regulator n=1 Tax=Actinomadura litoris TaxID=2678616 RepID=A0A7K1KUM9_9ACTN|nr:MULTISPECIES: helix-turn-helix transcriptional regulator [Actinomadura]MBT2207338.1 helix-turn-helix transcriptional regulator [Actinomadura sp. NEAU-AAG7]MUN35853.1 helix-turn-helix transcriptional regulator [Actinomadura litoris]